jgi:hypothetical protein
MVLTNKENKTISSEKNGHVFVSRATFKLLFKLVVTEEASDQLYRHLMATDRLYLDSLEQWVLDEKKIVSKIQSGLFSLL